MKRIEWPTLADITDSVIAYRDEIQTYDHRAIADDNGNPSGDIRLQMDDDGSWAVHTGDASYDTDHRGYWGASSSVTPDMTDDECAGVACGLIEACKDDADCCR